MKLVDYETNETVADNASPALCEAACASEAPVLGFWSDVMDRWELTDESQRETLRACGVTRFATFYGLP